MKTKPSGDERALDLQARVVARVARAAVSVCAEEALADAAVSLTGEGHAPSLKILDAPLGVLGDDLNDRRVGEKI